MNLPRSSTDSMTPFQATLVDAGYGQLALRDNQGRISQKWTLSQPKCVIGAGANCNVRCMLPGIADHHVLLVIGARQVFLRGLTSGLQRDGKALNELFFSGEQIAFAFDVAGHRFEYARNVPSSAREQAPSDGTAAPAWVAKSEAPQGSSQRLQFTFVRALERSREQSAWSRASGSQNESAPETEFQSSSQDDSGHRPAWVEELVRDALRPVELRLEEFAQPLQNLERQLRRQRARMRKQKKALHLTRQGAHDKPDPHTLNLIQSQESLQKIVRDQTARLETVSERVVDIVAQLSALERIVAAETGQHSEEIHRTTQSGEEIMRLQREMMELIETLQARMSQQPENSGDDQLWRSSVQRQLDELHSSLGVLGDIKSDLQAAVAHSRELTHDFQTRWVAIEEAFQRPVIVAQPPAIQPAVLGNAAAEAREELREEAGADVHSHVRDLSASVALWPAQPYAEPEPTLAEDDDVIVDLPGAAEPMPAPESQTAPPRDYAPPLDYAPMAEYVPLADYAPQRDDTAEPPPYDSPTDDAGSDANEEPVLTQLPAWWNEDSVVLPEPADNAASADKFGLVDQPHADAREPVTEYDLESSFDPLAAVRNLDGQSSASTYPESTYPESSYPEPAYPKSAFSAEDLSIDEPLFGPIEDAPDVAAYRQDLEGFEQLDELAKVQSFDGVQSLDNLESLDRLEHPEEFAPSNHSDDAEDFSAAQRFAGAASFSDTDELEVSDDLADDAADYESDHMSDHMSDDVVEHATDLGGLENIGHSVAEDSGQEAGDESVEDYMRRLLARMRGVSESEVKLPGLDAHESTPAPVKPRAAEPIAPLRASGDTTVANPGLAGETLSQSWTEPFDPETYVPRGLPAEKNRDIDALRELANTSARSAIQVSARRRHSTAILVKTSVALVGLSAGGALVGINGLRVNIALIATIASFLVAAIWGYDALATLRPLLQVSRMPKIQPAPTDESNADAQ
ncbi:MAG: hypothetical protein ACTHOU_18115 [Aureliella sp.]